MSERVLITGGCGFIGSNLICYLLDKTDWEIVVLDNLSTGDKKYIEKLSSPRISFHEGDIRDKIDVKESMKNCDYVVNLAAQVGVIPSLEDPFYDMDVNIKGTMVLLQEAVKQGVKRFVQASSATPLGEQDMPLGESKIPQPLSAYGASKLACEGYCSAFSASFDLSTIVLRFSNVYGPFCDHAEGAIPLFTRNILNDDSIIIYGDGNQTRDFVHAQDIAHGIYLSLTRELSDSFYLFQLGTGVEYSINKLICLIERNIPDKEIRKKYLPSRKGEIYRNYVSIKKATEIIGYDPKIPLENGLIDVINLLSKSNS